MITRRRFLAATAMAAAVASPTPALAAGRPVILDTDIGDDIDDTWALFMLLRTAGLDVKLAVSDYGNAIYRCRLLAKLLEVAGRADIPVGVGVGRQDNPGLQSGWVGDYRLDDYPGTVIDDGVQAIIDTIMDSPQRVTLLCIGPVPNIAAALTREPAIAGNADFVGMHGSVYTGYAGEPGSVAEWNVRVDPASLQQVFAAPWPVTITPLDSCGLVTLDGERFRRLYESGDRWLDALMENYALWLPAAPYVEPATDPTRTSTTLFDTVAVYLASRQDHLRMERLPLRVTDDGFTVVDSERGRPVDCAVGWRDLDAFRDLLVTTLLG